MIVIVTARGGRKIQGTLLGTLTKRCSERIRSISLISFWLPPRDSNPDMLIQSQLSYH